MVKQDHIKQKVGLGGLTALVVGGTIGSGIFALPATVTAGANPEAILIGWAIVAIGMFSLAGVYRNLTLQPPDIGCLATWVVLLPTTVTELEMPLVMLLI